MSDWRATTISGTVYEYRDGILHIESQRNRPSVFKPWTFQSARNPVRMPWNDNANSPRWHTVTRPVVGEQFYAASGEQWRISTEIVTVEDIP